MHEYDFARTYSHHYEMIDVYHYLCSLLVKNTRALHFLEISLLVIPLWAAQTHAGTVIKHEMN